MRQIFIAVAAILAFTANTAQSKGLVLGGGFEVYSEEHAFVADIFKDLNLRSIRVNLEYCGFIYYENGELKATKPEKGQPASCLPVEPVGNVRVFASYHTHAAFDPNSFNEYPSTQDMEGDFASFQNGYVATPGGRLWFVELNKRRARQLCGYRCLPYDRRYREDPRKPPRTHVTIDDLNRIFDRGL